MVETKEQHPRGSTLLTVSAAISGLAVLALSPLTLYEVSKALEKRDSGVALLLILGLLTPLAGVVVKAIVARATRRRTPTARGSAAALIVISALGLPVALGVALILSIAMLKYGAHGQEAMIACVVAATAAIVLLLIAEVLALVGAIRVRRALPAHR
jgi:hypothetical protein